MARIKRYFKEILRLISKPQMRILPGQLAFFFLLSVIPLIALLGNIAGLISLPLEVVKDFFSNKVSADIIENIYPLLINSQGINLIIFYFAAFSMASNATNAMIITANSIYELENSSFIRNWVKAVIMLISLIILILFMLVVPIWGDKIVTFIADIINNNILKEQIINLYNLLKYPISIIFVFVNLKLLYTVAPSAKIKSNTTTKGALFTTLGWLVVTEFYTFYINNFTSYNVFYGSLANVLVIFLWLYILAYIFILGLAINSRSYLRQRKLKVSSQSAIIIKKDL